MSLVVPSERALIILTDYLTNALTLRLFSNNITPAVGDLAASYTEVAGGGYANKPLTLANWTIAAGDPSSALYNATQEWTFTGTTTAPGTIYGYYVTRDSDGKLLWAERFPASAVPFTPQAGSIIRLLPRITTGS